MTILFGWKVRRPRYWAAIAGTLALAMSAVAWGQGGDGQSTPPAAGTGKTPQNNPAAQAAADKGDKDNNNNNKDDGLVIEPTELPTTYPQGPYLVRFQPRGNYVPVLHWRVESGTLPPGIKLEEDGVLRGAAERAGEFNFALSVKDGGQPQQAVRRGFVIKVVEAITVAWKVPPHVTGNRIDGSVEVSNTPVDDIDLTFDVKAVAENGRATEIGYQRFPLKRGTLEMAVPFGETLPHGAYVVYVNVNGEVAKRNAIYHERMQTPGPLQVVVGP